MPEGGLGGVIELLRPSALRRRAFKLAQRRLRGHGLALVEAPARKVGPPTWDLWDWVARTTQVRTLIDIGANAGASAESLNAFLKPEVVRAFEPQAATELRLTQLGARLPHLTVHPL